jgi:integrase
MASLFKRRDSPYYWVRTQRPDGSWGGKSTGIRIDSTNAFRKAKQFAAQQTMQEAPSRTITGGQRFDAWVPAFLRTRYKNRGTLVRYLNAWSALSLYFEREGVAAPSQITYRLCNAYPDFRTNPPRGTLKARTFNTALTELKVLSAIMHEAVRRDFATANPCSRLGFKRDKTKRKPEISDDEQLAIESSLETSAQWMRDCWLVAMRHGCRLAETAVPLKNIDLRAGTISFIAKGGRTHTAPIHKDILPVVAEAKRAKRKHLVELPAYPAKKWHQFFRRIGMPHLSFHSTRVTVVTRLARAGHPIYKTKAYVGHASDTVHAIYQRLAPIDVRDLGEALSSPTPETLGSA